MKVARKLVLIFIVIILFGLAIGTVGINGIQGIYRVQESVIERNAKQVELANGLKADTNALLAFTWMHLSGTNASEQFETAHKTFLEDVNALKAVPDPVAADVVANIVQREHQVYVTVTRPNDGVFALYGKLTAAREEFVGKNNKHIVRLSGYRENWVEPNSRTDLAVTTILWNIRNERAVFEDFKPGREESSKLVVQFNEFNDVIVRDLVALYVEEMDRLISSTREALAQAKDQQKIAILTGLKNRLEAQKELMAKVTATSFPAVPEQSGKLAGISAAAEVVGKGAKKATETLAGKVEEVINQLAQQGARVPERRDVKEVGKSVTPSRVLESLITCQQGLRFNGLDFFDSSSKIETLMAGAVGPGMQEIRIILQTALDKAKVELASAKNTSLFTLNTSVSTMLSASVAIAVLGSSAGYVVSRRYIVRPIEELRSLTADVVGKTPIAPKVHTTDEIAEIAEHIKSVKDVLERIKTPEDLEKVMKKL